MAEARSAVSRGLQDENHAKDYKQEFGTLWKETCSLWRRALKRRFYCIRNTIHNGIWPTSLWNLAVSVVLLTTVQLYPLWFTTQLSWILAHLVKWLPLPSGTPVIIKTIAASFVGGFAFFLLILCVCRYLLRILLSYRGWMYKVSREQSTVTLLWGFLVRLVTSSNATLYSYQNSLPRLPVPRLKDTLQKLLTSVEPLYCDDPDGFATLKSEAADFECCMGPKLQQALVIKSWLSANYVSDWWEKYVYLMGRSPLPINSNYYAMDGSGWSPTELQAVRASTVVYQLLIFRQQIERQSLKPLLIRGTIPLCMAQYGRIFSTTRVPGKEVDTLVHYEMKNSQHIVVSCLGVLYHMDVYDVHGRLLSLDAIQQQFDWIISDAACQQDQLTAAEKSVPALTTMGRTEWWTVRRDHFSHGVNRDSLSSVESAILFVSLDQHSYPHEDLSSRAWYLLCGDSSNIWFDKSITLLVFKDGKMGLNCEHSHADAPVIAHTIEFNMHKEVIGTHTSPMLSGASNQFRQPRLLVWDISSQLEQSIILACDQHKRNSDDLDLRVCDHDCFGKGFIKRCKVSPDAFIQMALQVTYLRDAGNLALTYEAAMTRLYREGRTETVRTLTHQAAAFARSFLDPLVSVDEKRRLLGEACDHHQVNYKDAMNGKAVDRHLFGLYVASRGLGYDSQFLKKVMNMSWTLSTSQQPQQQMANPIDCSQRNLHNMMSPGGGFGPVSDDGYGVSYMVPGDSRIFFHVSSKRSCPATDSKRFVGLLFRTLTEMRQLFVKPNGIGCHGK